MNCNCEQNAITIVRGNDTNFNNSNFLTINLNGILDLSTFKAIFTLGNVVKEFPDISSGTIDLSLTAQDTANLPSLCYGVLKLIDSTNKIATIESLIPFKVIDTVHGNSIATEPYTLNFDVEQGGETILNISVEAGVSVEIGTTTTLPAGSDATVTNVGTGNHLILNFGIPEGIGIASIEKTSSEGLVDTYTITYTNGDTNTLTVTNGKNATITGATASVTNTVGTPSVTVTSGGTEFARSFNFAFTNLKGDKGDKGATGDDGFSPIATVSQTESGATVTVTDRNGTTTADLTNGQDATINGRNAILLEAGTGIGITDNDGTVTISNTQTSAEWGNITGTLSEQTDLKNALDNKVDKVSTADKVYGTDGQGNQTTYDKGSFGQVDDVTVGGTSVVTNKVAVLGSMAGETASDYVLVSNVVNDVVSTDTNKPLSANMGKELQDEIDNLKARGRFLALWDCSTGLAETHPTVSPYLYQTGDYFIVGTIAQAGGTNYKPSGSSYTDNVPSTAVETEAVSVDDVYYYDGNVWHLQINTQKEIAFVNIAGDPYDNSNLASALNNKQDELPSLTGQASKFLTNNGTAISWGDAPVTDVQINSTSILSSGVANIPKANNDGTVVGVIQLSNTYGSQTVNGYLAAVDRSYAGFVGAQSTSIASVGGVKAYVGGMSVAYNASQSLTDAQKEQARTNIGAGAKTIIREWI